MEVKQLLAASVNDDSEIDDREPKWLSFSKINQNNELREYKSPKSEVELGDDCLNTRPGHDLRGKICQMLCGWSAGVGVN